jgi:nucleoside phosphorylase
MTGAEYLTAPGLLTHVLLRAGRQDARSEWERLRFLWDDVTGRLGLDHRVPLLAVPSHLPPEHAVPAEEFGLLAAAERRQESVWQASAWADHGILGLTVMMAPPRALDCSGAWTDLEQAWKEAVAGLAPDGVVGEVRIFLALLDRAPGAGPARAAPEPALALVRAAAPEPSNAGWWQHWDTVPLSSRSGRPDEVLVWEIGPESRAARTVRRLAAVAPVEAERQVDRFLWTTGDGTLTPLARHLGHAARLRYQIGVFDDGQRPRHLRRELDLVTSRLLGESAVELDPARELAERDQLAARLRHAHGAAITLKARLNAMRDAVGVIGENMQAALNLPACDAAVGPLTEDRDLASWFGQRLDNEINRLDAAVGQARSARDFLAGEPLIPARPPGRASPASREQAALEAFPPPHRTSSPESWVVVFTALGVEYEAIRDYLAGPVWQHEEFSTLYEVGALAGVRGSWRIALAQTGPGSTPAGVQLERAVRVFAPGVALFLGVAGGRKDVKRGDVVAAETIYDYESGKSTDTGYQPRMRTYQPAYRLLQWAQLVARENRWQQRIRPSCPEPPPASFVKPIVTGSKVIAHDRSEVARLIGKNAGDALAVETEGYGFLAGAHVNPQVEALVIRGISDLMAGKDQAGDDHWQPVASRHAAAFAVELLDRIGSNRA